MKNCECNRDVYILAGVFQMSLLEGDRFIGLRVGGKEKAIMFF